MELALEEFQSEELSQEPSQDKSPFQAMLLESLEASETLHKEELQSESFPTTTRPTEELTAST